MKITMKDVGGFALGMIIAFGIIGFVFAGCSRIANTTQNNFETGVQEDVEHIKRELKIGMTGGDVLYLHEKLNNYLQSEETIKLLSIDEFNEATQFNVMLFQMTQNLEPNGVVDNKTWTALENPNIVSEEKISEFKRAIPIDEDDENIEKLEEDIEFTKKPTINKIVYLTFDDGPSPTFTPQIIELLEKYNAGATFFTLGQEVDKFPSVAKNASNAKHIFANHTYSHFDISEASDDVIKNEIIKANKAVKNAIDKTPICFRPPYGAIRPDIKQKIGSAGGKTIMWDVDTQDWAKPGIDVIVDHVLSYTQNGEIILMHDGGGDRTQTVAALEKILKKMTADGWEFRALDCVR